MVKKLSEHSSVVLPIIDEDIETCFLPETNEQPHKQPSNQPSSLNQESNKQINSDESHVPPQDTFNFCFIVFVILGLVNLLPWNVFITSTHYFIDFKLDTNQSRHSSYRRNFTLYIGVVGQVTNLIVSFATVFCFSLNNVKKIKTVLVVCFSVVFIQACSILVNTVNWPFLFFASCCFSIIILFVSTSYLNSYVLLASSFLPYKYINAIIVGNNLSGILISLLNILTKYFVNNVQTATFILYVLAVQILLLSIVLFKILETTQFYRYYVDEKTTIGIFNKEKEKSGPLTIKKLKTITSSSWRHLFLIVLNFFSTLVVFPVYMLQIKPSTSNFIIDPVWFHDVITILIFNVFVALGNLSVKHLKISDIRLLSWLVIVRCLCVFGVFSVCNFKPEIERNRIPILVHDDYLYSIICILFAFSFGNLTSNLLREIPSQVNDSRLVGKLVMFVGFLIVFSITSGLNFEKIFEQIVLF